MESKLSDYLRDELAQNDGSLDSLETTLLMYPKKVRGVPASLLDLGCGSESDSAASGEENMPPILCERAVDYEWSSVTGVDHKIDMNKKRRWTALTCDLTDRKSRYQVMPSNTFDCVVSNFLISVNPREISPSLVFASGLRPYTDCDTTEELTVELDYLTFLSGFLYDIHRTLKLGGVFLLNRSNAFTKTARGLKPVVGIPMNPISTYTLPY